MPDGAAKDKAISDNRNVLLDMFKASGLQTHAGNSAVPSCSVPPDVDDSLTCWERYRLEKVSGCMASGSQPDAFWGNVCVQRQRAFTDFGFAREAVVRARERCGSTEVRLGTCQDEKDAYTRFKSIRDKLAQLERVF